MHVEGFIYMLQYTLTSWPHSTCVVVQTVQLVLCTFLVMLVCYDQYCKTTWVSDKSLFDFSLHLCPISSVVKFFLDYALTNGFDLN